MCACVSMPSVMPVSQGLDVCLSLMPCVVLVSLGQDVCLSPYALCCACLSRPRRVPVFLPSVVPVSLGLDLCLSFYA